MRDDGGDNVIVWHYDEGGVVNEAVTHLVQQNAAAQFLACVQRTNGLSPHRLDEDAKEARAVFAESLELTL